MNRAILFGHLGHSPRSRAGGRAAGFSFAVNEPYWNAAGAKIERVTWFDVVAWDKLADRVMKYLHHGDEALVEGRIQLREFEGRDGRKHAELQVTAHRIEFGAKAQRPDAEYEAAPAVTLDDADAAPADEGDFETVDDFEDPS